MLHYLMFHYFAIVNATVTIVAAELVIVAPVNVALFWSALFDVAVF